MRTPTSILKGSETTNSMSLKHIVAVCKLHTDNENPLVSPAVIYQLYNKRVSPSSFAQPARANSFTCTSSIKVAASTAAAAAAVHRNLIDA
jgi:hypothetical protein